MMKRIASSAHEEQFKHNLVALRRKMLGLSQIELANKSGLGQGTVSKIEQGLYEISDDQLKNIALALNCPVEFFYQPMREYGPPMSEQPMYRKKASVGQKALDKIYNETSVRIFHIRNLLSSFDLTPELDFPEFDVDDYGGAEEVANQVRRFWAVPRGPITPLIEYIERSGCIVSIVDMGVAHIAGISYRFPGLPPIIFANKDQPADRLRFTLAHELGHLVMHRFPTPEMEKQADAFASALLMPKADISADLSNLTIEKAAYMKPHWKVSMGAILMRAKSLGKIDENRSSYMWRSMSMRGFRTREPAELDFPPEKPALFPALLANLSEVLGYTQTDLEKTFRLYSDELQTLYGLPVTSKSKLRIV